MESSIASFLPPFFKELLETLFTLYHLVRNVSSYIQRLESEGGLKNAPDPFFQVPFITEILGDLKRVPDTVIRYPNGLVVDILWEVMYYPRLVV